LATVIELPEPDPHPAEIKLTREQLDRIPEADPGPPWHGAPIGAFAGTPIRIVDTYAESTIAEHQWAGLVKTFRIAANNVRPHTPRPYRWEDWLL
jgi:hypothetical protein